LRVNKTAQLALLRKAFALLIILMPLSSIAETLYVSDTLRVGIRTSPNNNMPSIAVIKSGVAVEVIKRKGSYLKIRTKSGVEGWVKGAYFSKRIPAAKRLENAQAKIAELKEEIQTLRTQKKAPKPDPNSGNRLKTLEANNQVLKNEIQALKASRSSMTNNAKPELSTMINKNIVFGIIGSFVVLLCLGFLFGVSWHKNQVTKRLGGMRI